MRSNKRSASVHLALLFVAAGLCVGLLSSRQASQNVPLDVKELLSKKCSGCHGAANKTAGFDVTEFKTTASIKAKSSLWLRLALRVSKAEMPPPAVGKLTAAERERVVSWVRSVASSGAKPVAEPKISTLRRLTRHEYDQTILDLFNLSIDSGNDVGMPDDFPTSGYDTLAGAQNLSAAQMEKYAAAADLILDRIVADEKGHLAEYGDWPMQDMARKAHDSFFKPRPDEKTPPRVAAQIILSKLVYRAFRRPVPDTELDRYLSVFDKALAKGEPFERAMRPAIKAILISPYFLFKIEGDAGRVGSYELATRLSYFVWSTGPDEALLSAAKNGELSTPDQIGLQVKRMLADPRAKALTDSFGAQWLQLRKLATARPSPDVFPMYTVSLKTAMMDEASMLFDSVRTEDASVYRFLNADYTYLNEELAKHYGVSGVQGEKMRRVSLKPADHRGGVLGMAAIHTMTSHTYRTSPTLRGKYVLDVIFGTPPPPPPPGVSQIVGEKDGKSPESFRQLLAQHASQPSCAGCHKKMDPLGFALDNYDAVGRWRTAQGDKPLDTSGVLPDGKQLGGADDLRAFVNGKKEAFLENFVRQMIVFALGRPLEEADQPAIAQVVKQSLADNGKFSTIVVSLAKSPLFSSKPR